MAPGGQDRTRHPLNPPLSRYTTCCGRIHIKHALLCVTIIFVFFEVIEFIELLFKPLGVLASIGTLFFEVIECVTTLCLLIGYCRESHLLLIPFALSLLVAVVVMILLSLLSLIAFIFPESDFAYQFFDSDINAPRRLFFLTNLIVLWLFSLFTSWCLHVVLFSYRYFEEKEALEKARRNSRPPSRGNPQPRNGSFPQRTIVAIPLTDERNTGNFPNPNFSLSDDEDEILGSNSVKASPALV